MTSPKVSIIGGTIWGNRGAEAMLTTTIGEIRKRIPEVEFGVFSYYPAQDRNLISDPLIHIFDASPKKISLKFFPFAVVSRFFKFFNIDIPLPTDLQFLKQSSVLLDIGGITFNDGRLVFLFYNILTIWPGMLLGVPVIKLSQAMGPFRNPINRVLSQKFLGRCKHIFARGEQTAKYLSGLGLPNQSWSPAADIAFLYQCEYSLSKENPDKVELLIARLQKLRSEKKNIILFSPSSLLLKRTENLTYTYVNIFIDIIQTLDNESNQYVFFPNASRSTSKKKRNNDIIAIEQIREQAMMAFPQSMLDRINWIDYDINSAAIRSLLQDGNLLITSRFHAMIASLVEGVPTIVIGWSHKYHEVLSSFEQEEFCFDFTTNPELISQAAVGLMKDLEKNRSILFSKRDEIIASSRKQFDLLMELINWTK